MVDCFSKKKRSEVMSKIKSKNTEAELMVFRELRRRRVYFQKHYNKIPGKPDIALPRKKKAVFIDGDFWHGKNFEKTKHRLSSKYWRPKIERNIIRDKANNKELGQRGWKILRIWESEVKKDFDNTLNKVVEFLKNRKQFD